MPTFDVRLTRGVTAKTTIRVDAEDKFSAGVIARSLAEDTEISISGDWVERHVGEPHVAEVNEVDD